MNNKPYLQIGQRTFSVEELYCLLFAPDMKPKYVTQKMLNSVGLDCGPMLCQKVRGGIIQATSMCSTDEYPCIELQLQTNADPLNPVLLVRAEQREAAESIPDVYLYGRGDSYIAKMPVDTRSEDELEDVDILQANLLVSGDLDCVVKVEFENRYVSL